MGMEDANPRSSAGAPAQAVPRRRRPGALIVGCLLMVGAISPLLVAGPASADPPVVDCSGSANGQCAQLVPTLDCVWITSGSTDVTAVFGYQNDSTHAIVANVGPFNQFVPAPADRGQPTSFPASTSVANAFTVSWSGGGSVTWTLPGGSVTASSSSAKCSSSPMPAIAEAGAILGLLVVAVFFSVGAFRERGAPRPARLLDRLLPR
jgi:hypothetical protein